MRRFIETHFSLVLVLACVIGLAAPPLARLPDASVVVALALLMFTSCYRLRDGGLAGIHWRGIALFYAARYALLPPALWLVAHLLAPAYATSVFLLAVLPAAVASPAFTALYGGAVAPALAIAVISQFAAPFLIPAMFALLGEGQVVPTPSQLFVTMFWCILLPMAVYAFLRRHQASAAYIHAHNRFFSVVLVAFVIALAVAKQRDVILSGEGLLAALMIALATFFCFIAFGWYLAIGRGREERVAYAVCSGFNNAALGVSLALLHFPPPVMLFMAVSEIAWALLPGMFRGWLYVKGLGTRD